VSELFFQKTPVGQAGQGIMQGQVFDVGVGGIYLPAHHVDRGHQIGELVIFRPPALLAVQFKVLLRSAQAQVVGIALDGGEVPGDQEPDNEKNKG
jgi:hypothetical protein